MEGSVANPINMLAYRGKMPLPQLTMRSGIPLNGRKWGSVAGIADSRFELKIIVSIKIKRKNCCGAR